MISNKYYITTIIAIFLALSTGILIGGTLGQQWINENQQKLILHYQTKSESLQKTNEQILAKQNELSDTNKVLQEDYNKLFIKSISRELEGSNILWINNTSYNLKSLRDTIEIAGGIIHEIEGLNVNETRFLDYDAILYFPNKKEDMTNNQWLRQFGIPVIFVTNTLDKELNKSEIKQQDIYQQKLNIESLNDHYQFILFLKSLRQE